MVQSPNRTSLKKAETSPVALLKNKILGHTARTEVVRLGYVRLPFAVEIAKVGFEVVGIDQDLDRAGQVNRASSYIGDVCDHTLSEVVDSDRLKAISSFKEVLELDVITVCVPTPLTKNLTPDLTYIESVAQSISKQLRPSQFVSLESTTYPGTTDDDMRPILESFSGLKQGEEVFLTHSPERFDPERAFFAAETVVTKNVASYSDGDRYPC